MKNRYAGTCAGCYIPVDAGEGIYEGGSLWCSTPDRRPGWEEVDGETVTVQIMACGPGRLIEARRQLAAIRSRREMIANPPEKTPEEREREAQWVAQVSEWNAQGMRPCGRCGGAGGAQKWPGWTCYGCEGRRCVPMGKAVTA